VKQFIGIDLHRKFLQVAVLDEQGEEQFNGRFSMEDEDELGDLFRAFEPGTPAVVEATMGWMWLTDLLEGMGFDVRLAHMKGVKVIAQSRRKTDKIDARVLAQLLRTGFLPEAYLAPADVREQRMILRHRQALVAWRTSAKNRVHALLTRFNIHLSGSDIFGAQGTAALKALDLATWPRRILDDLLSAIEFFNDRIRALEKRLYEELKDDPRVAILMSLPGVGKLTAHFLLSEIGGIERFPGPSKLVSYCGLCPSVRRSAGTVHYGGIRGGGRRLLQWSLVEAAHTAARKDSYFARIFHRLTSKRGNQKAYVTVARKMAQIIWHMLREERPYTSKRKHSQVGSFRPMTVSAAD
jgi:transposase